MKRLLGIVFMCIAVLAVLGCSADSVSGPKSIFSEPGLAAKAIAELKERPELKGKDILSYNHIVITDLDDMKNRIDIEIVVPDSKDKVNKYVYDNGKWGKPEPLADYAYRNGPVHDYALPIDTIDYSKIPDIYKVVEEKAKTIENGKAEKAIVFLFDSYEHTYKGYIEIKGSKETYTGVFDAKGNLIEYIKD